MPRYSLTCTNNSQLRGRFMVFQKAPPSSENENIKVLAWFARPAAPGSKVTFTWTTNYCFFWSEYNLISSEISANAGQVIEADAEDINTVEIGVDDYDATSFSPPRGGGVSGTLTIEQMESIVPGRTLVGIGMSGAAVMGVSANPNTISTFRLQPNYWITFGNFQTGEIIDPEQISSAVEITFAGGTHNRTVVMGLDNLITVS